ncbi:serine hydrolase domain-containing protein [Winogradskyella sp. PG-2]|uniref:serine hydrolase domain-containing protein n=1 Tax=Winogradskyella sp. PG-2 TaxID=754409 RepID=UPI0004588201|nr:serine hydrolase domain-containing protein [Winogradskyella sp. PG-2]BAO77522.1 beta-lactamase class C and other penicillin binding proteins [Winogradskyella sp. PG-2]
MIFRSIKNIYSIVVFVLAFTACAQEKYRNTSLKPINHSEYNLDSLKSVLNSYVDRKQLAGLQTAIHHKGELIHYDSYGYANIERKKPLNEQSIFRIFSMTKPITSVGLMQLYEQGEFKLDDPLHLYIPEFENMTVFNEDNEIVPTKNAIKVIDLLRHSSALVMAEVQTQT